MADGQDIDVRNVPGSMATGLATGVGIGAALIAAWKRDKQRRREKEASLSNEERRMLEALRNERRQRRKKLYLAVGRSVRRFLAIIVTLLKIALLCGLAYLLFEYHNEIYSFMRSVKERG